MLSLQSKIKCCGRKPFDSNSLMCCFGKVISKNTMRCCADGSFLPKQSVWFVLLKIKVFNVIVIG